MLITIVTGKKDTGKSTWCRRNVAGDDVDGIVLVKVYQGTDAGKRPAQAKSTGIEGAGGSAAAGFVPADSRDKRERDKEVEGYDAGNIILAESFNWDEIVKVNDRLIQVGDRSISTVAEAQQRGQACLRQAEIEAVAGTILVPVNCGQQVYDVIDVTDERAGLGGEKKRVLGIVLSYNPGWGEYSQRLSLGAV